MIFIHFYTEIYSGFVDTKTGWDTRKWTCLQPRHCRQEDSYNCGVYVCLVRSKNWVFLILEIDVIYAIVNHLPVLIPLFWNIIILKYHYLVCTLSCSRVGHGQQANKHQHRKEKHTHNNLWMLLWWCWQVSLFGFWTNNDEHIHEQIMCPPKLGLDTCYSQ